MRGEEGQWRGRKKSGAGSMQLYIPECEMEGIWKSLGQRGGENEREEEGSENASTEYLK